jgi:hypothetical protein
MVRTQISLDKKAYREAQREARRQGISFAELVRRALARTLGERRRESGWMRFAGAFRSGDAEASRSVDAVVYGREKP